MDIDHLPDADTEELRDYRVISHARDGSVRDIVPILAESDEDAIAQTKALARGFSVDLWDGLRFVEHFAGNHVLAGCLLAAGMLVRG